MFSNDQYAISSTSYTCKHGRHFEVEVRVKECGHVRIYGHTHNYREHWAQMYAAKAELIDEPAQGNTPAVPCANAHQ